MCGVSFISRYDGLGMLLAHASRIFGRFLSLARVAEEKTHHGYTLLVIGDTDEVLEMAMMTAL